MIGKQFRGQPRTPQIGGGGALYQHYAPIDAQFVSLARGESLVFSL